MRVNLAVIGIYPGLSEDPGERISGPRIQITRHLWLNTGWEERTAVPQAGIRDGRMTPAAVVRPGQVTSPRTVMCTGSGAYVESRMLTNPVIGVDGDGDAVGVPPPELLGDDGELQPNVTPA